MRPRFEERAGALGFSGGKGTSHGSAREGGALLLDPRGKEFVELFTRLYLELYEDSTEFDLTGKFVGHKFLVGLPS